MGRDRAGVYRDRLATDYLIEAQATDGRWTPIAGSAGRLPPNASELSPAAFPARLSSGERHQASKLFAALQRLTSERENTSASPRVYSGVFAQPDPVHRLYRGDPGSPREVVNPSAIAAVGPLEIPAAAPEQERRVALARWIARPQNPLTARVMVNRLWHYHFGRGIVETPSDFGHNGGRPSHPELLDWLANELVRSGWSLKHVHRLILTSATYRQSSAPRPHGLKVDAGARLLWRFPPRRLEAEAIRDSMLAVSGVLDERMGGPGFSPFQPNTNYVRVYRPKEEFGPAEWRRMVYMSKVRMEQDSVFGAFDCPDAGLIAPRRTQSTTAVQALGLFNSNFTEEQADLMAERCRREAGSGAAHRSAAGLRAVLRPAAGRSGKPRIRAARRPVRSPVALPRPVQCQRVPVRSLIRDSPSVRSSSTNPRAVAQCPVLRWPPAARPPRIPRADGDRTVGNRTRTFARAGRSARCGERPEHHSGGGPRPVPPGHRCSPSVRGPTFALAGPREERARHLLLGRLQLDRYLRLQAGADPPARPADAGEMPASSPFRARTAT